MPVHTRVPAPPLGQLVERIWDWDAPAPAHALERILPSAQPTLIINLAEDQTRLYTVAQPPAESMPDPMDRARRNATTEMAGEQPDPLPGAIAAAPGPDQPRLRCHTFPGAVLDAPSTRSFIIDTAEQVRVLGVCFRAGAAAAFFRQRMDAAADQHVALTALGMGGDRLREHLLDAPDAHARLALLQHWLQRQHAAPPPAVIVHALRLLNRIDAVTSIHAVAADCGLSTRRLRQVFAEHVGMTPKRYWRLQRFRALAMQAHADGRPDWAALAVAGGFVDQAHLNHEFRAFAGMTPRQYLAAQGQWPQHVPLLDMS